MIKAVFFDAIKTLFDPQPSELGLHKKVLEEILNCEIDEKRLREAIDLAIRETELLEAVKEDSTKQWEVYPSRVAELIGCKKEDCQSVGEKLLYETWGNPNNYKLFDDVLPTLKLLREKGIYIACVSNEDGWLSKFFDQFEIKDYFEFIMTSKEVGYEKPNPKIFEKALAESGFEPEEILFVGDSVTCDYYGSKAMNMKPLLIDRSGENTDDKVVAINNLERVLEYI